MRTTKNLTAVERSSILAAEAADDGCREEPAPTYAELEADERARRRFEREETDRG